MISFQIYYMYAAALWPIPVRVYGNDDAIALDFGNCKDMTERSSNASAPGIDRTVDDNHIVNSRIRACVINPSHIVDSSAGISEIKGASVTTRVREVKPVT